MENKIFTFIHIIKQSLSNPDYYIHAAKAKFGFLFKYVLVFSLIFGVIYNLYFASIYFAVSKNWPTIYTQLKQATYNVYPNDLELTLKNGELTSNKQGPIYIKIPQEIKNILSTVDHSLVNSRDFNNFFNEYSIAVIDTNAKVEDIKNYKTLALFTKNSFAVVKRSSTETNMQYEFSTYKSNPQPVIINKQITDKTIKEAFVIIDAKVIPFISKLAYALLFTLWILLTISILVGMIITHLFTSIIGLILSKILKLTLSYGEIYKMGMLFFPLFMLTGLINMFFSFSILGILNLFIYIIVVTVVLNKYKNTQNTVEIAK